MTASFDHMSSLKALATCADHAADAMGMARPDPLRAEDFIQKLVFAKQSEGGKDIPGCLDLDLITDVEARDLVMAHIATWLSHLNNVPEPSSETWSTRDLELQFEVALLGRPARER